MEIILLGWLANIFIITVVHSPRQNRKIKTAYAITSIFPFALLIVLIFALAAVIFKRVVK